MSRAADDWREVESLVATALLLPEAERRAFVASACGPDEALRAEVESLLMASSDEGGLLDTAHHAPSIATVPRTGDEWLGRRVGAYTLVGILGRGGMSTVYLAARSDREFERHAAVKIVSPAPFPLLRERLLTERQILATLDHPNIARLYDGGTTEDGLSYFTMEYVEGTDVERYCEERSLSTTERLLLFTQVCRAVQYAHRHLVVHRDVKPSNILVTDDGTPKLLDFGIAKILEGDAGRADLTQTWLRPMTLCYASPEQRSGQPVTTASDVYSLGVLLYRLLTGCLPHSPDTLLSGGVLLEPRRPSAAASSAARRRELSGDLDSVVLKALRTEPGERYASAEQLAEDLDRYLDGRPVSARLGGWGYRAAKLVRRNPVAAAAVGALVTLSVVSALLFGLQAAEVSREREKARIERDRAREVTSFLVGLFDVAEESGASISARDLLIEGTTAARRLEGDTEFRAQLFDALGRGHLNLGLYDQARPLLEDALAMRREVLGPEHLDVAASLNRLVALLGETGEYERAEALQREGVRMLRRHPGGESLELARGLANLAALLKLRAALDEAEIHYREALAIRRRLLGERHPEVARALSDLAAILYERRDLEGARRLLDRAVRMKRGLGEEDGDLAISLKGMGVISRRSGDPEAAQPLLEEALRIERGIYGPEHPEIAWTLNQLAVTLGLRGDFETAEGLSRQALAMREKLLGPDHPRVGWNLKELAWILEGQGRLDEAEALYRRSIELLQAGVVAGSVYPADPMLGLGDLLVTRGRAEEAEPLLRKALEIRRRSPTPTTEGVAEAEAALGACLLALGRYPEAERLLLSAHAAADGTGEVPDEVRRRAVAHLVELYEAWGDPERASAFRDGRS